MSETVWLMELVFKIMAFLVLVTIIFVLIFNVLMPMIKETSARDSAYAGEIVDKKIKNASTGLFYSSDMDYRLIIRVYYQFRGKTKETEKIISVDKETYKAAEIGDWFDSRSLEIRKE